MQIHASKLPGVILIEPDPIEDNRGYFMETYSILKLESYGIDTSFIQDNQSLSLKAGTIRGLHYQIGPYAQAKLVRVASGAVYDVVVDVRKDSATYGQWEGFILSDSNYRQLYVPRGFAHGICSLVDRTVLIYKVDEYYNADCDRGILWDDPEIGIDWPVKNPILSNKDRELPLLLAAESM